MREPRFWTAQDWWARLMVRALAPLALLYRLGEASRRFFVRPQMPSKPVLCVGNLTIGGAGKTPAVQWLAHYLLQQGKHPAILSRGYGGNIKGVVQVAAHHTAAQVGDEPLLLAQTAPTFIGGNRHRSLRAAIIASKNTGVNILDCAIKDDGMQNPAMRHCFNLVVVDGASGIGNARLLPAGPLRQPLALGLKRADALLVLGEAQHASLAGLCDRARALALPIFYGRMTPLNPMAKRVFAYCGIARPQKFYASLEAAGYDIAATQDFGDHHAFSERDARALLRKAEAHHATLITTEKDSIRLKGAAQDSARARLAGASETLAITLTIENEAALHTLIDDAMRDFALAAPYTAY